jgi:LPXTG-motif cell wall-anchored protein
VFFTTEADGDVVAKTGLLDAPAEKQVKVADSTTVAYTGLASGYYLVNDAYSAEGEVNGIDYSIARIAVQVVGNTTINNKADKPTNVKKIKTAGELANEKANELGIGRTVNYEVTEAVPNYDGYKHYYFNIVDKMSDGLTFDKDSVSVTITPAGGTATTLTKLTAPATSADGKGYYLYADKTADADVLNGNTFVIAFEDIMKFPVGATITVNYSANVNSSAITGINPNTNEVKTQYSNNPDKSEKGDKQNYPGIPANTTNHPMGETPKSYTDTYTTQLTIHKVDKDGNKLANVEFTLTGTSKDVVLKNEEVYELASDGTYYMLKNGTYTTDAPTDVATLEPTTNNSGWVEIVSGDTYAGDDIRTVDGKKYRPFVVETDQDKDRFIIVEGNAADYASTTLRYKKVTKSTTDDTVDSYKVTRVGKTDSNGDLVFAQLGAGTYKLSETSVLPGYNDIEDIEFTITCTPPAADTVTAGTEEATWEISNITPTGTQITQVVEKVEENDKNTGRFEVTIENNKGTELPSTGGIGTTIFYVMGSILVICAGVVLVTRRRMNA